MKRLFKFLVVAAVLFSIWGHLWTRSLPISFTKSLEVTFQDKDTSQPIGGAIVYVSWDKTPFLVFHPMSREFKALWIMSDENGRIKIPAHLDVHILSCLNNVVLEFHHPLYERQNLVYYQNGRRWLSQDREADLGLVHLDQSKVALRPQSLKNKYANSRCFSEGKRDREGNVKQECTGIGRQLGMELYRVDDYYRNLKGLGKFKDSNLIFPRNKAITIWKEIGRVVYAKSPYNPLWVEGAKE